MNRRLCSFDFVKAGSDSGSSDSEEEAPTNKRAIFVILTLCSM